MSYLDPAEITNWHAHIYFNAESRDAAWTLREAIAARFGDAVPVGRFHERPVGPHPMWSYQLTISCERFTEVIEWLTLNHGALDVFIHPNTSDGLRDHRDAAVWIGHSHTLNLGVFSG